MLPTNPLKFLLKLTVLFLLVSPFAGAREIWKDVQGTEIEADFSGIYKGYLYLQLDPKAWNKYPLNILDKDSLAKAIEYAQVQNPIIPWASSDSRMSEAMRGKVSEIVDGQWVPFAPDDRNEPLFYAFYFSVDGNKRCQKFLPELKAAYTEMKAHGLDNFELFFGPLDRTAKAMRKFATEAEMPWKILDYGLPTNRATFSRLLVKGIPSLVVTNREGRILAHTYVGEQLFGLDQALKELQELVYSTSMHNPFARHEYFKIKLEEYLDLRKDMETDLNLAPAIFFPEDLGGLELPKGKLGLTGTVTKEGQFILDSVKPEMENTQFAAIKAKAEHWYFFPKLKSGAPQDAKVTIPVILN